MRNKKIVFSGFMAALLLSAGADAAVTSPIASKAYVDAQNAAQTTAINTSLDAKANKATTLSGYGITNTYTKAEVDTALSGIDSSGKADKKVPATTGNLASLDTTGNLADSGISGTVVAGLNARVTSNETNKANKSTTLAGYTIGDAYTKSEINTSLAAKADTTALNAKADKKVPASNGNLAGLDTTGNLTDSGISGAVVAGLDSRVSANTGNISSLNTVVGTKANSATTLAGYGITDAYTKAETYTKTEINTNLNAKADKTIPATVGNLAGLNATGNLMDSGVSGSTVSSLGTRMTTAETNITNKADKATTYTKTEVDAKIAGGGVDISGKADKKVPATAGNLAGLDASGNLTDAGVSGTTIAALPGRVTTAEGNITSIGGRVTTAEGNITTLTANKADKSATLAGYGITNAYTKTETYTQAEVDAKIAGGGVDISGKTDKVASATNGNLAGLNASGNLTDSGVSGTTIAALPGRVTTVETNKADKSTTLAGYTIGDAYTKTQVDASLAGKANTATTLAGYSIGDAYTKTQVDTSLAGKANTATTLAGYGITDAYTKTQVDTSLAGKANTATTLAGYSIGDAYTKTQVDTAVAAKETAANRTDNVETNKASSTMYASTKGVADYALPKPPAYCTGGATYCVLGVNKTTGAIYWENVAIPTP